MGYDNAFGIELREVRDVEHNSEPARAVAGSRFYSTDTEDLWDALTNAERIPRWFLPIHGDLEVGGRYQLEGNAEGTIQRCDPPENLEVTWEFGGNVSWVSVQLEPENGGTRLTLVHTMAKDEASEAHWATYGPGATGVGWELAFFGLGMYLEGDGQPLDPKVFQDWMVSDGGKAFLRACAGSWGQAHTAAGESAQIAEEIAAKTASFYTGE